jgi:hypothetical protein
MDMNVGPIRIIGWEGGVDLHSIGHLGQGLHVYDSEGNTLRSKSR